MEAEANHIYYYVLAENVNQNICENELNNFISELTSKSHVDVHNSHDLTSKKLSVSRIIYEKLKSGEKFIDQNLSAFIGICLDCIIETPPQFFEVTKFAQISLSIISGFDKSELFDDFLRQKVSPLFECIIKDASFLKSSHHRKLIQILSSYSHQFTMSYKSQIISLLINSFRDIFDYELLCELIECFVNLSLVGKHYKNKEQTLLFKVNHEGSSEWEILWNVHAEEFLSQLSCSSFDVGWSQIHILNINLIILTFLLKSGQNIYFVEISLKTCKRIFVQVLEFVSSTRNPEISPIFNQHFLNIFILFVDIFVKVIKSNFYILFEYIAIVIHYIFEYAFQMKNLLLITNCLVVMENIYGMAMVMDRSNAENFWIRSKTIVVECIEALRGIKMILSNDNMNLVVIQSHCSDILSFLQDREKFISKLLKSLIFQVNTKSIILESVISSVMTLAKNLVEFINFCERYYNLKPEHHNCLRNIGESISTFLSNTLKQNNFNKYCNDIPINQFVASVREVYSRSTFKHGFHEKDVIEDIKKNLTRLNYDDKIMAKKPDIIMKPQISNPDTINSIPDSKSSVNELIHYDIQNVTYRDTLENDEDYTNPLSEELLKYFKCK